VIVECRVAGIADLDLSQLRNPELKFGNYRYPNGRA
jgi:hypothetical protein